MGLDARQALAFASKLVWHLACDALPTTSDPIVTSTQHSLLMDMDVPDVPARSPGLDITFPEVGAGLWWGP